MEGVPLSTRKKGINMVDLGLWPLGAENPDLELYTCPKYFGPSEVSDLPTCSEMNPKQYWRKKVRAGISDLVSDLGSDRPKCQKQENFRNERSEVFRSCLMVSKV